MHLSRGTGSRGYSLRGAETPLLVLSSHPITQDPFGDHLRWALITAAIRWPNADPLSKWKTANRLISILAKAEADAAGAEESLVCQSDDWVMEGASSNFFWWNGDRLQTPSLSLGVLPGITRRIVLNLARAHGIVVDEIVTQRRMLAKADGMFSTLSTLGLVSTTRLDDQQVTDHPMTHWLRNAYRKQLTESLHENSHS